MGNVYAKEPPKQHSTPEVSLDGIKAKIQKVNVEGLGRTKDDIVINSVKDVFNANDFQSAIFQIHEARKNLQQLGCFKNVEVIIDTYNGSGARDDGIEVTFEVVETNRIGANVQTNVGNNEGCVSTGGLLRNIFGRGEEASVTYSYGTNKKTAFHSIFKAPLHNNAKAEVTTEVYQDWTESPMCGYKQADRGAQLGIHFLSPLGIYHSLFFNNSWRHLSCLSLLTPFFVREHAGHSLKSSIVHEVKIDNRDQSIFPMDGVFAKLKNELAGLNAGNIGFLKNEMEIQVNLPLFRTLAIQGSFQAGHIFNLRNNNGHKICDRFLLGGPSSIRGFEMGGVGPHNMGFALGGQMYWAAGLHMFTPLPYLAKGGFSDKFRLHAFVNTGNNGVFSPARDQKNVFESISKEMRLSYGAGIAMNLAGLARIELNYCVPLLLQRGDRPAQGLQFGIASNFL